MSVRSGFLGRCGFVGLGDLLVTFGLGSLSDTPLPPLPGPSPLVTLRLSGPAPEGSPHNYAPIYHRRKRKKTTPPDEGGAE